MSADLKPLEEQVVVIVGASSGIGLTTARMAADRGAKLVLAARSADALEELTDEIEREGGDAEYVVADVSDRDDVREIADVARETYGGFDSWINVAAIFLYGRLAETPIEDMRRQFDVNVWGLLYGSLEAADHLNEDGGAIVNVGSVVSDRALPLQGSYSASKHAVKGFTDALRAELEEEGAPVSVTLIKPAAIDTPYTDHAKNYMDDEASLPPPVYAPETVARAILHTAEHPKRDVTVGAGGKNISLLEHYASGLMDTLTETVFYRLQRTDREPMAREHNAFDGPSERLDERPEAAGALEERGDYEGHVASSSLYTRAVLDRRRAAAAIVGLGAAVAALYSRFRGRRGGDEPETVPDRERSAPIARLRNR